MRNIEGNVLLAQVFLDLITHLALLVALSNLSGFVGRSEKMRFSEPIQGLLFGLIAVLGMLNPVVFSPGINFDGRSVVISLCAFFFGPVSVVIAAGMAIVVRLLQGGAGAVMGVLVIVSSALWGLGFRWRSKGDESSWKGFLALGIAVHVSMVLLMSFLPKESIWGVLQRVGLPVLLLYPLATVLIAKILSGHLNAAKVVALEGSLRESEAWHRAILQTTMDGFMAVSPEARILNVNDKYIEMIGYTRDELLRMGVADVEANERPAEVQARIQRLYQVGMERFETRHRRKDGSLLDMEVSLQVLQTQKGPLLVSFLRDLTERNKAQADFLAQQRCLIESEAQVRALSDHLPGGMVYQLDTGEDGQDFRFNFISAGVEAIHGLSPEAVMENPALIRDQILEEDREHLAQEEALAEKNGSTSHVEMRIRKPSGEIRWVYVSSSPRRLSNNHLVWDGIEIDITDRKASEEKQRTLSLQLQQSQKLESLGSLAGGVAHDINNVLGAILSLASSLRPSYALPDPMAGALDTIVKACTRGRDVVRSLLVFARRDLEEERSVNLNTLVLDTAHLLAHTTLKRAELRTELEEGLPDMLGDGGALSHALINLCVNAMDAMPDGGQLFFKTEKSEGGGVRLRVRDTGVGMSPDVLAKAMEPFFTTKAQGKGTGLGLSMVYGTMQAHDGVMRIKSEPGRGTEVMLEFPPSRVAAGSKSEPKVEEAQAAKCSYRILLVDDDELILSSVSTLLGLLGHEVLAATGGAEALQVMEGAREVDLVILDMNMPEMSGAETLPRIKAIRPEIPVLLASGYLDASVSGLMDRYMKVACVDKPFTVGELRQAIERQMKAS